MDTVTGDGYTIYQGDCLDILLKLADNSVDLIFTDPPYFKVKMDQAWDRQWPKPHDFLEWLDIVLSQFHRVLRPNGSLYLCASPQMGRKVANLIETRFNVLNEIQWVKHDGSGAGTGGHSKASKESLRAFFPQTEKIIFAEHYGAEGYAKGEAGYTAKCDQLRGFVFEPLRSYLESERIRAGATMPQIEQWHHERGLPRYVATRHYFKHSQWELPTRTNYENLRRCFAELNHGGEYLRKDYEELRKDYEELRKDYEELRKDYEELRRPFNVTADVPYTDVWTFPTVSDHPGKHPCEKPVELVAHIINASSRPGAVVLDAFSGSGVTGEVCGRLGREVILMEKDVKWFKRSVKRTAAAYQDWETAVTTYAPPVKPGETKNGQLTLL